MSDGDLEVVDKDLTWACEECGEENSDPFDAMQHQHSCNELDEREAAEVEVVNEEPLVRVSDVLALVEEEIDDFKEGVFHVDPGEAMTELKAGKRALEELKQKVAASSENDSGLNSGDVKEK